MAWIESHQELANHPKVWRLAKELAISVPAAIGHLHLLWWWALTYAESGEVGNIDFTQISRAAYWEGEPSSLIAALIDVGFLDESGPSISLHDWHDFAGKLIDRRNADRERKRNVGLSAGSPQELRRNSHATVPYRTVPIPDSYAREENVESPPSSEDEPHQVLDAVCIPATPAKVAIVQKTIARYPTRDPVAIALNYAAWQDQQAEDFEKDGMKKHLPQKNRISGWQSQMQMAQEKRRYERQSEEVPESPNRHIDDETPEERARGDAWVEMARKANGMAPSPRYRSDGTIVEGAD